MLAEGVWAEGVEDENEIVIGAGGAGGVGGVPAGVSIGCWLGTAGGAPIGCGCGGGTSLAVDSRSISIGSVKSFAGCELECDVPPTVEDSGCLIRKNFGGTFPQIT